MDGWNVCKLVILEDTDSDNLNLEINWDPCNTFINTDINTQLMVHYHVLFEVPEYVLCHWLKHLGRVVSNTCVHMHSPVHTRTLCRRVHSASWSCNFGALGYFVGLGGYVWIWNITDSICVDLYLFSFSWILLYYRSSRSVAWYLCGRTWWPHRI